MIDGGFKNRATDGMIRGFEDIAACINTLEELIMKLRDINENLRTRVDSLDLEVFTMHIFLSELGAPNMEAETKRVLMLSERIRALTERMPFENLNDGND